MARPAVSSDSAAVDLRRLSSIESRVLWFAASIVHHANRVKGPVLWVSRSVASSASAASIMTALWFAHLEARGRVFVEPHASPVLQVTATVGHFADRIADDQKGVCP